MLKNKLYKKYFPVSNHTVMEKDDLDRLIQYMKRFDTEVEIENIQRIREACEMGLREVCLLKPIWNESDLEKLLGNLYISFSNLTGHELYILNTVLYWNKYSFPINTWIHPVYHNGCLGYGVDISDCKSNIKGITGKSFIKGKRGNWKLKNGMKVKIQSNQKLWDEYNYGECPYYAEETPVVSNKVTDAYKNHETCIVTDAFISTRGWECNLLTRNGDVLVGFYSWELKRVLF